MWRSFFLFLCFLLPQVLLSGVQLRLEFFVVLSASSSVVNSSAFIVSELDREEQTSMSSGVSG